MTFQFEAAQRNWGARIRELTYQGLQLTVLENEVLRISIVPDKGTDIIEINFKPLDLDFSWISPGGLRNPSSYPGDTQDPTSSFLDFYPGGWQEVFPSGGAPSAHAGAKFGQHGEFFALPWGVEIEKDIESEVAVSFRSRSLKFPFKIHKTIRLRSGETSFSIDETLINESAIPLPVMWGHHIVFGRPFLQPGARIRLPEGVKAIPHPAPIGPDNRRRIANEEFPWPNARDIDDNVLDLSVIPSNSTPSDLVYITDFPESRAWYEIADPLRGAGCRVEWDRALMPYLWYWQEFGAHTGYPWYGRAYVAGLEPFSSMPTNGLSEAVANGTALVVEAEQSLGFNLTFSVLTDL